MAEIEKLKSEFKKRGLPFVDRHTHSITKYTKSFDLDKPSPIEGPFQDIIRFAASAEFEELAITDHSYHIFLEPKIEEECELQLRYKDETFKMYLLYLNELKKKYPSLRFHRGIELNLRTMDDLERYSVDELEKLDIIVIETLLKRPDFKRIRGKLEKKLLILAHPDPKYLFGESYTVEEVDSWINCLVSNRIIFEISRQWFSGFLSDEPVYRTFFQLAKRRNLMFSIGSDYHGRVQNYEKFFTNLLNIINRYGLPAESFVRI